jgi:hypothetical protein
MLLCGRIKYYLAHPASVTRSRSLRELTSDNHGRRELTGNNRDDVTGLACLIPHQHLHAIGIAHYFNVRIKTGSAIRKKQLLLRHQAR